MVIGQTLELLLHLDNLLLGVDHHPPDAASSRLHCLSWEFKRSHFEVAYLIAKRSKGEVHLFNLDSLLNFTIRIYKQG